MKAPPKSTQATYDGIVPAHYPRTYADINQWDCVMKLTNEIMYAGYYSPEITCGACNCIGSYPPYEIVTAHTRWHSISYTTVTRINCQICGKPLLKSQPIINCTLCMDAYFSRKEDVTGL